VTLFDSAARDRRPVPHRHAIPGKEEFSETLRYFTAPARAARASTCAGHGASTREQLAGGRLRRRDRSPPASCRAGRAIAGIDHPMVLSYVDVLQRKAPVGRRVAIIGAGGIGFDTAEYLLHRRPWRCPKPLDHWLAEWGVDLQAKTGGGLVPPAPDAPPREVTSCSARPASSARDWARPRAGSIAPRCSATA
jgi:2,4-dienoyl-CoA reductase (NADPH2)